MTPSRHSQFPLKRFVLLGSLLLSASLWLSVQVALQPAQNQVEQRFAELVEKFRAQITTIQTLQKGLVANMILQQDTQLGGLGTPDDYISQVLRGRDDLAFFILPKIRHEDLASYEEHKRNEGYTSFRVFTYPLADPLTPPAVHFPVDNLKQYRVESTKHLGRDVYSFPNFKEAIDQAILTDTTTSGWSHQTEENSHGIMLFNALYDTLYIEDIAPDNRLAHTEFMVLGEVFLERTLQTILQDAAWTALTFTLTIDTPHLSGEQRSTAISQHRQTDGWIDWHPLQVHRTQIHLVDTPITLTLSARLPTQAMALGWASAILAFGLLLVLLLGVWLHQRQQAASNAERMANALRQERDKAATTLASLGEGVMTTDRNGRVNYLNPKACELLDTTLDATGLLLSELYPASHAHEAARLMALIDVCVHQEKTLQEHNLQLTNRHGDVLLDCTLAPMRDEQGNISGTAIVLEDVTHLEDMRLQIEYMAKRDHLTGLFNRYEFEQQLKNSIIDAHKNHREYAFCYLDLDQFKIVNDTAGHMAGDQLLRQLAGTVFLKSLPDNAILGRLGGDEFGLLLKDTSVEAAITLCEAIIHDIHAFVFLWHERRFQVGVSIGLVMVNEHSLSLEQTLIAADTACYLAKEKGRNRIEVAREENLEVRQRQEELGWAERLPRAVEENRLVLFIQHMRPLTGVNAHAEVLVRMLDEQGRLLAPGQFIPAAERYGLMGRIDQWIIRQAIEQIQESLIQGIRGITYGINLSGQSLSDEKFLLFLHEELAGNDQVAQCLCFEITETAAMANLSQALHCMRMLKDLGCELALDDFGSGLSSFAYLRQMPVDYLKIDGSFVRNLDRDPINRAIVANMHQLAKVFHLKTVAEFVENEAILAELERIGIDLAQGYGIHIPEAWHIPK